MLAEESGSRQTGGKQQKGQDMIQATNYCSGLNRQAKSKTQRWEVTAVYADRGLVPDVVYPYRTEAGARRHVAHLERLIASDATRSLGGEVAMVSATIREV